MTTNLNQLVYDTIMKYQFEMSSKNRIKEISDDIVNVIMAELVGDNQIQEFEENGITLFTSCPETQVCIPTEVEYEYTCNFDITDSNNNDLLTKIHVIDVGIAPPVDLDEYTKSTIEKMKSSTTLLETE